MSEPRMTEPRMTEPGMTELSPPLIERIQK
jgi:hypothetical protein